MDGGRLVFLGGKGKRRGELGGGKEFVMFGSGRGGNTAGINNNPVRTQIQIHIHSAPNPAPSGDSVECNPDFLLLSAVFVTPCPSPIRPFPLSFDGSSSSIRVPAGLLSMVGESMDRT